MTAGRMLLLICIELEKSETLKDDMQKDVLQLKVWTDTVLLYTNATNNIVYSIQAMGRVDLYIVSP